jgi:CheY-like chemotaxis protein
VLEDLKKRRQTALEEFERAAVLPVVLPGDPLERDLSREQRMDATRLLEILERQREVISAHTPTEPVEGQGRAVVAHRNPWFRGKLAAALLACGVLVVAETEDGADAIGLCVAEVPDVLVVEDLLARLPGIDVVRRVRELVPGVRAVAQVAYEDGIAPMHAAGATAALTRRVPPEELAAVIADALG